MRRRTGRLVLASLCATIAFGAGNGCSRREPACNIIKLEEIERIVVYHVNPSRNAKAYTQSTEELRAYLEADFDLEVFRRYVKDAQYVPRPGSTKGGELLIVFYKDGSECRMMIDHYGVLFAQGKGHFVSDDKGATAASEAEHRRIYESFIEQSKKRRQ